jgi:cell division protease FtsH
MRMVDSEIRKIIDEQYSVARKIIEDNREKIEAMTKALLDWETIDAEQIEDIIAGRAPRPPKDRGPSQPGTPPTSPTPGVAPNVPAAPAAQ